MCVYLGFGVCELFVYLRGKFLCGCVVCGDDGVHALLCGTKILCDVCCVCLRESGCVLVCMCACFVCIGACVLCFVCEPHQHTHAHTHTPPAHNTHII